MVRLKTRLRPCRNRNECGYWHVGIMQTTEFTNSFIVARVMVQVFNFAALSSTEAFLSNEGSVQGNAAGSTEFIPHYSTLLFFIKTEA